MYKYRERNDLCVVKIVFEFLSLNFRTFLAVALCSTMFLGCAQQLEFYELEEKGGIFFERKTGLPYTGTVVEHSDKGHLLRNLNLLNGKKEGIQRFYWNSGKRKLSVNYVEGKRNGLYESFHPTGKPEIKVQYEKDQRVGLLEEFYLDGTLRSRLHYLSGRRQGLQEVFYKEGNHLSIGQYNDDRRIGIWKKFTKAGQVRELKVYDDESGEILEQKCFVEGKESICDP